MNYFTYPFKKMSLSQSYTQGNHKPHWYGSKNYKDYPIDECCGTYGRDPVYAPVDMKVVRIYGLNTTKTTNAIVLQTTSKVRTPIGDKIVVMTLTHPEESDIKQLKVGQVIKKGSKICYEGRDGFATGNHIHMTVGTGNYVGLYANNNDKCCFTSTTVNKPEEIFYVNTKFTTIMNSQGIVFKKITTDVVPSSSNTTVNSFLPKRGYFKLGDISANVGKIASFMYKTFPLYTKKSALGNFYGPNLKASITEFQRRTGLTPDGCVGPITLAKLEKYGFKH